MIQLLLLTGAAYVAAVLQVGLASATRAGPISPEWLALVMLFWATRGHNAGSTLVAAAMGLISDLLAPGPVGIGVASFALCGYAVARIRLPQAGSRPVVESLVTLVTVWAIICLTALFVRQGPAWWPSLAERAAWTALLTAVAGLPLFMLRHWVSSAAPRRAPQW